MFDRYIRYRRLQDIRKFYGKCPVCCRDIEIKQQEYQACKCDEPDHEYRFYISSHQHVGTVYFISYEFLAIPPISIVKDLYRKRVFVCHELVSVSRPDSSYSFSRFGKIFKPHDKILFVNKLRTLAVARKLLV